MWLEGYSLRDSLGSIRTALRGGGVSEWKVEAEVLLRHVLGLDRSDFLTSLYANDCRELTLPQAERLRSTVCRRLSGEPLAYLVGVREFYGLELAVNRHVLIPRPETELLVNIALENLGRPDFSGCTVVDVGTGCGAIALAIAVNCDGCSIIATDVSPGALVVARRNANRLGVADRVEFVQGDLLGPVGGAVDVIVSNPPYVPSGQIGGLQREVLREPRVALDGGPEGLDAFRGLLAQAARRLSPRGVTIIELMPEQMCAAALLANRLMPDCHVSIRDDLAGQSRAIVVRRGERVG